MRTRAKPNKTPLNGQSIGLYLFFAFVLIIAFAGGGSRPDIQSLVVIRPLSVLMAVAALCIISPAQLRLYRTPLLLMAALMGLMAVQLVPLPHIIWSSLPGRDLVANGDIVTGVGRIARPISLDPDATLNSLFSMFVPLATMLWMVYLGPAIRPLAIRLFLAIAIISCVIGIAQILGPIDGPLYFYDVSSTGTAVGLFANRNHQAVLLCCSLAMLAVVISDRAKTTSAARARLIVAGACAVLFSVVLIATGSRAGLALGVVALGLGFLLYHPPEVHSDGTKRNVRKLSHRLVAVIFILLAFAALVAIAMAFSKAPSIDRLMSLASGEDRRAASLSTVMDLIAAYFPFGSGFGTFASVFKIVEPAELLTDTYYNHAHSDLLEFLIEGGIFAGILLLGGFAWFFASVRRIFAAKDKRSSQKRYERLGLAMILLMVLASCLDYPLRTPFLSMLFVFAVMLATTPLGETNIALGSRNKLV